VGEEKSTLIRLLVVVLGTSSHTPAAVFAINAALGVAEAAGEAKARPLDVKITTQQTNIPTHFSNWVDRIFFFIFIGATLVK
jgi:hypothetical protein